MHADETEGEDAHDAQPGGVVEAFPGGFPVGEEAAVHHHGVVQRIAPDLQEGDAEQNPAGTARIRAADREGGDVVSADDAGLDDQRDQHGNEHAHLKHVGPKRGAESAQNRVSERDECQHHDGCDIGGRSRRPEYDPDHQKIGENL